MKKTFISFMLATSSMFVFGQSGSLDTSFNGTGIVLGNYTTGNNSGDTVAIQEDGKILVAGATGVSSSIKIGVSRYNPDGTLDTTFGQNGKISFSAGWIKSFVRQMLLQPDGKIVLGGYRWDDSTGDFLMVRLNTDGSFDSTFGTNGIAIIDNAGTEVAESFALAEDGKFVISGYINDHFAMAKINSDGSFDNSFGNSGWVITEFGTSASYSQSTSVAENGRIILGGMALDGNENKFKYAIAAYNADGSADTTFGTDGKTTLAIGFDNDFGIKVIQLKNGKILFGGHSYYDTAPLRYELAVAKLNVDGTFDTTYGTNGILKTRIVANGESYMKDMALQSDGKLVMTAGVYEGGQYNFGLVRATENGQLDPTFGQGGQVFTHIDGSSYSESYSIALQDDGKIVVAGDTTPVGSITQFFIARYLDKTLAVQNVNKVAAKLYPNPASDQINLEWTGSAKEYKVEIFDMVGQKIMTSTAANKTAIDVSGWAVGSYLVRLTSDGTATTLQFIKK